jgi:endonuclease YncB( thermonuclease family)
MLITIGILVVLGVFAAGSRRGDDVGSTSSLGGGRGASMAPEMAADAYINPLDPVPKAEWEVLTGCELIETPTNAAHFFRVKRDSKPMVFRLYFVEAPELTDPDEDAVAEQARYFGWPATWEPEECADRSVRLGQQAWQEVEKLLKGRPFMVLTKFELRRDTHHFYALVVIEDAEGRRRTLQEWLVERGYATITRPELGWLPIRTSSAEFLERLEGLEHSAQRERRGGWGVVGRP